MTDLEAALADKADLGSALRSQVEISVIIPAFDCVDCLSAQLGALASQRTSRSFEIVVADNGSSDGTVELVEERQAVMRNLRLVDASEIPGAAFARNRGAAEAHAAILLFCDADDIAHPDWIEEMAQGLEDADLVGGYLESRLLNPLSVVAWRGEHRQDRLPGSGWLPAAVSANLGVRRELFEALSGFDTRFPGAAGEDIDLSWRAGLRGYRVAFAPKAIVHYRHRQDLRSLIRQAYNYGMAAPFLYSIHRSNGMPRRPLRLTCRQIGWCVLHAPDLLRGRARRGAYLWGLANLVGRVRAACRLRVGSV